MSNQISPSKDNISATMPLIKTILLPTDFSETAHNAFKYALHLAEEFGAKIFLLHIYDRISQEQDYLPKSFLDALKEEKIERAMEHFHSYEEEAQKSVGKEIAVSPILEMGNPSQVIAKMTNELDIDLVVMGTQGAASNAEKILGSITAKAIQDVACPLLAIPAEVSYQPIRNIMYCLSMTQNDIPVIQKLSEYALAFNAELSCTHVKSEDNTWEKIEMESLINLFDGEKNENIKFYIVNDVDIIRGIHLFVTQNNIDVLSMQTHRREMITRFFDKSLTREMILYTDVPLLVFPENSAL